MTCQQNTTLPIGKIGFSGKIRFWAKNGGTDWSMADRLQKFIILS